MDKKQKSNNLNSNQLVIIIIVCIIFFGGPIMNMFNDSNETKSDSQTSQQSAQ